VLFNDQQLSLKNVIFASLKIENKRAAIFLKKLKALMAGLPDKPRD